MKPRERIERLLELARNSPRQKRYVELAKRIATRTRTRLKPGEKKWLCECNSMLIPGRNALVRAKEGKIVVVCTDCGRRKVFPLKKERKIF